MHLIASLKVQHKLKIKHNVAFSEVEECFLNQNREFLEDRRIRHLTIPPTRWFIAQTNKQRLLKVVFIKREKYIYELKTAYEPSPKEKAIYYKIAQLL